MNYEDLRQPAYEALAGLYLPYLKFRVACVVGAGGRTFRGANVENALYGAGICAERSAICHAVSEGYREFDYIAIASDQDEPIVPCGICRQFIREFGTSTPIVMFGKHSVVVKSLDQLLPDSFGPDNLLPPRK